jgi:hypothetical protein
MRPHHRVSTVLVAIAIAISGALAAPVQQPGLPAPAKPMPYQPVAVQLPATVSDPTFETFRKQLASIAERRDRAALARLVVAKGFFWIPDNDKDAADRLQSGIDILARAIGLDDPNGGGWEIIASFAMDPTADFDPDRKGVLCGPGDPDFDAKAGEQLLNATGTDIGDWVFPVSDGIEVRADPASGSKVIGKLGLHLVWVYPDDSPASAVQADSVRIVLPSGQLGFVSVDALLTLEGDQLCYVKEGDGWKITGLRGGDTNPR